MSSNHVPRQRKPRQARTGSTIVAEQTEAAKVEAFIQTILMAPRLETVLYVRDEFLLSMQWAELSGRQRNITDRTRYQAINRALETVPGFIYSLRGVVENMLLSDAKAEVYSGNRTQHTFGLIRTFRETINDMATGWWWMMCKKHNPQAHDTFGRKTTREQVIRATLEGMDMEALKAFVEEHKIQVELVRKSNFKGLREQNQIILNHSDWIFSQVPEGAELTSHPGQHPGWKDQNAARTYERTFQRHKEESQWRRGFPGATLGGNTESTLALLRIIADNEQEFMDEIGGPWVAVEGGARLPKSLNSLFHTPEASTQAQQESA